MLDLGAFSAEPVDYPDYARVVGQAVLRDFVEVGVLVCGNAIGRGHRGQQGPRRAGGGLRGRRRRTRESPADRRQRPVPVRRAPDDGAVIGVALAWLGAKFSGDAAHVRQVAKLTQLEAGPVQERATRARRPTR